MPDSLSFQEATVGRYFRLLAFAGLLLLSSGCVSREAQTENSPDHPDVATISRPLDPNRLDRSGRNGFASDRGFSGGFSSQSNGSDMPTEGRQMGFGPGPVSPANPEILTGYAPGQEVRDPYTGRTYTASPEGTVTIYH